jgi:hypothetical protein
MGNVSDEQFLALFRQMQEPVEGLEQRLAQLEKQPSRSEVAGAVEVVATLPGAGQQGRILYQSGDPAGLYVDGGSQWAGPVASPEPGGLLAYREVANESLYTFNQSANVWEPANPTEWYLDVVAPPGPFEVVMTFYATRNSNATIDGWLDIGYYDAGVGDYVRAGHPTHGLARTPRPAYCQYHLVSHWNLSAGQTYRFVLMSRSGTYGNNWLAEQLLRFWAKGL